MPRSPRDLEREEDEAEQRKEAREQDDIDPEEEDARQDAYERQFGWYREM